MLFRLLALLVFVVKGLQVDTLENLDSGQSTIEYWQSHYAKMFPVQFWDDHAKAAPEYLYNAQPLSEIVSNLVVQNPIAKRAAGCGSGKPKSVEVTQDLCSLAQNCTLTELSCNGTIYRNPQRPPNPDECVANELVCKGNPTAYSVTVPGCKIQQFQDKVTYNPDKLYSSIVQVVCEGNKLWGYQTWNMKCETEKLVCGGTEITKGIVRATPDCVTSTEACNAVSLSAPDSCRAVTKTCLSQEELPSSFCATSLFHPLPECSTTCLPHMISCLGTEYEAASYNGSLGLCERVVNIKCGEELVEMDGSCRITEITCPEGKQIFALQRTIPAGCTVSRVICANATLSFPPVCTEHFFGCSGCAYAVDNVPCSDQCSQLATETGCQCPVDLLPPKCETHRKITCKAIPLLGADALLPLCADSKTKSDKFGCYTLGQEEIVKLGFKIDCQFEGFAYNKTAVESDGFTYFWKNDKLAITKPLKDLEDWSLTLTFLNYNSQVDTYLRHATIYVPDEITWISINTSAVPKKFWLDSRLHAEVTVVPGHANILHPPVSFIVLHSLVGEEQHGSTWLEQNQKSLVAAAVILGIGLLLGCAVGGKSVLAWCKPKGKAYVRI